MECGEISLAAGMGKDLNVGPQAAAAEREIHIHVVVVGGDHDRRTVLDPSLSEHAQFGRIADHGPRGIPHPCRVLFHDSVVAALGGQRRRRGLLWWHFNLEMEGFASLNCLIHWGAKSSFPVSDDDCPNGGFLRRARQTAAALERREIAARKRGRGERITHGRQAA
jgi:hypothetical protein